MITKIVPRGGGYTITTDNGRTIDVEIVLIDGVLQLSGQDLTEDIITELETTITIGPGLAALLGGTTTGTEFETHFTA